MTQKPTNVRWLVFLALALASFISYVLRSNVSIAAPTMIEDLGLSEIQWGWVLAAFTAGYAIFQFPGGIFGDKVGSRKALAIIAALWSVFMILTVAIPGPDVASVGVVIGSLMGVLNALLVPWFAQSVGWDVALASGAGFAVVGAILLLFVRADEPIDLQ